LFPLLYVLGYGQTGPYRQRAGYDIIAAGIGGLLHITGPKVCHTGSNVYL